MYFDFGHLKKVSLLYVYVVQTKGNVIALGLVCVIVINDAACIQVDDFMAGTCIVSFAAFPCSSF